MAKRPHVLGVVLAGGEGKRLWPLTRDRAKPAVPFGANYRLIDFALSFAIISGIGVILALLPLANRFWNIDDSKLRGGH